MSQADPEELAELLAELERTAEPRALATTRRVVAQVLGLHRDGLDRLLQLIGVGGEGAALLASLASDEIVSGLLALHGLHPVPFAERVQASVVALRRELRGIGYRTELLEATPARIQIRLRRGASSVRFELAEQLARSRLAGALPDADAVEVAVLDGEIGADARSAGAGALLPIERLLRGRPARSSSVSGSAEER